ncbi:universal stress protein [Roseobacter weihaiensis]|uniref:universal stress protein n=1 Tax=Roseobacter weihaiensis TaxID=2763262 RepID=UPI001D0B18C1|nr:universal stress protein [Roseobacter sp. H9]
MYKKIIVSLALDHGISETALAKAKLLLDPGGEIIALHVYETPSGTVSAYVSEEDMVRARQNAEKRLQERVLDVPEAKAVLINGHSGRAITDFAKEQGADCIIMGSHKPGLSDFFLGSTASRIVRHAHCTVVVLR